MPKFNIKAQTIPTVESAYADVIGTSDNQIVEIKNELIVEDNNQRFQIHNETIEQLAERIAKDGQLSPCIVAPMSNGKYELIDGRHRRRAVIKAGLPTTKCIIKTNLSEKEKQTIRLTSNLIRNNDYLPSELAFAYKELAELEDMKTISEETNLSKKKIYRYIRLTYLIEPLLNRVDSGVIPLIAAVELSYVKREVQAMVFQYMLNNPSFRITTENARIIKFNGHSFSSVIEVLKEKEKQEAEVVEDEEVDNLSTTEPDQISETPEETTSSDSVKALVDKALEPYRTTAPASSGKHTEEESAEDNVSEVDNLSTAEDSADTEQPPEAKESVQPLPRGSSSVNTMILGKDDLLYLDLEGNAHNVNEIDERVLKIICEYVINITRADYFIFRLAYDSREILHDWNERCIKVQEGGTVLGKAGGIVGFADWNYSSKRMFRIRINGQFYVFLHTTLEKTVRRYIRRTYTVERIMEVIKNNK